MIPLAIRGGKKAVDAALAASGEKTAQQAAADLARLSVAPANVADPLVVALMQKAQRNQVTNDLAKTAPAFVSPGLSIAEALRALR